MKTKLILLFLMLMPLGAVLAQDPTPTSIFALITETPALELSPTVESGTIQVSVPTATLLSPPTQTPSPSPNPNAALLGDLVAQETTLSDLSVQNVELSSPIGVSQFRLQIPSNWALNGSNILNLNLQYFENQRSGQTSNLVSKLEVYLDGVLVTNLSFDSSQVGAAETYPISLPPELLQKDVGNYNFQMVFRAEEHCEENSDARVLLRSDLSYIHVEYQEKQLPADLSTYPSPLYVGNLGNRSNPLWLVLPSDPSLQDIQAGASLIMGLGKQTFNDFSLQLRTADQLETGLPTDANIILLGKIGKNAFIDQLYRDEVLPSQRRGNRLSYQNQAVNESDGILHLIAHPQNPLRNILVVTSQSDEGLTNAAFTLTSPPSVFNLGGNTALISEIRPNLPASSHNITANELRFADLGIQTLVLNGLGETETSIDFSIPYNHLLTDEAFVEIKFRYSALLEPANGILNIFLNGDRPLLTTLLKDAPRAENTVGNTRVVYAPLRSGDFLVGRNNDINFNLAVDTDWDCNPPDDIQTWLAIDDTSRLYLPRQIIPPERFINYVAWFPAPFNDQSNLSDLLLLLPSQPSLAEVEQTYRLLAYMALSIPDGRYFSPKIAFGEVPTGTDLADYNVIVLGRPSTNPIFEALNSHLPQPFAPGSDQPQQTLDDVNYRLPPEFDIGILQMIPSIWSPERLIFVITGSSQAGQEEAFNMLITQGAGYTQLLGDVVFVNGPGVVAIDSKQNAGTELFTAIPEANEDATLAANATPAPNSIYTVTPGPTPTQTPSRTPVIPSTSTPLVSPTPSPTLETPVPTFTPLAEDSLVPDRLESPPWINMLVIITGLVMVVSLLFGIFTFYRSWRKNRI